MGWSTKSSALNPALSGAMMKLQVDPAGDKANSAGKPECHDEAWRKFGPPRRKRAVYTQTLVHSLHRFELARLSVGIGRLSSSKATQAIGLGCILHATIVVRVQPDMRSDLFSSMDSGTR